MSPSFNPESVFSESKVSSRTKNHQPNDITQLWHVNGKCPENTVPIRRTTKQDLYRASSVESFGTKTQKSIPKLKSYDTTGVLPQNGHQVMFFSCHAFALPFESFNSNSFGFDVARDNVCRRWCFLRC